MCQIESYRSSTCGHKWVTIVKRCGSPGTGFNKDNAVHSYTRARTGLLEPKYLSVAAGGCPNCDKRGNYDANETRMILGPDNIDARGTLGNGYSMTDGYGNVLPVSSGRPSRPYGHGQHAEGLGLLGVVDRVMDLDVALGDVA
ncbi:uncharacterized protein HMPREF1120_06020 [Exophiala dermatitidis NIH/UT8656]|uniref:Uncharacterized protein n=1 Tax=Exophiala dermatitidis (strain ATCC 34100 / CBS 525.76 / NIH/UT8656) TaxID=858893 RepID=H6C2Y7_EXODN|nr:uncharacterized protein HMPREF1120_06020 [Exophiala dermatitidis NIH/UT8656]EHY58002.1 hypothetical protein HMPREF1120_06020 [Exophiala dermatitidis NIH/UT8656]